jgi:hypothetical protein
MFREDREHPAEERVLGRTEMVEHLGHLLHGHAFPPRRATARAIERDAVADRHVSKCINHLRIRQLNCSDFSNYEK